MKLKGVEHIFVGDKQAIAITSLARTGNTIWCGLTSGAKALVPFDIVSKTFGEAVNIFPWIDNRPQVVLSKIHNGMHSLNDGRLIIGEGILYTWDGIPFELEDDFNMNHQNKRRAMCNLPPLVPEIVGPSDLSKFDMRSMPGGKIQIYSPTTGEIENIGQIQKFNYVQSLAFDSKRNIAYGHTLGDCHFFVADLNNKTIEDHGRISTFAFHNMIVAPTGIVYGAWIDFEAKEKLRIMRFDPQKGFLERLKTAYLEDAGPKVQGNRGIDQWIVHSSGDIYVGIAGSGILYRFDESNLKLIELGRIGSGGRVTSLDEDEHGRIIFTGGFPKMHVGRYTPKSGKIEDFGPVTDKYENIYFHGSEYIDGTLFLAETDSGVASLWEVEIPD